MKLKSVETKEKTIQLNSQISSILTMCTAGVFQMLAEYYTSEGSNLQGPKVFFL